MGWFRKRAVPLQGPDYSEVDSYQKIEGLVERGDLVPVLLLPEAFGGEPVAGNIVYVPAFAAELKRNADQNIIGRLAAEGKVTRYAAEPEYSGKSFVPIAIRLVASEPASFTYDVAIWGAALNREIATGTSE